jgi:penicillin-insensitive murein endopeptidase
VQIILRPLPLATAIVTSLLTVSLGAWPGPMPRPQRAAFIQPPPQPALTPEQKRFGRSVGSPTEGKLIGGLHLDETPYMRVVPSHSGGDVRWGLEPLVNLLDRSARAVRRQFPDAITQVGHLSRAGGGEIERHHSHESGRDADVGFFVKNAQGRPILPSRFIAFDGQGRATSMPGAIFDDARNWQFVHALVTDPHARVTHIFVAAPLRARLLAFADRLGTPPNVRMRAAELMVQPRGSLPHDDHFHVRIGCPARMTGCVEYPTRAMPIARNTVPPKGRARGGPEVKKPPQHPAAVRPAPPPPPPRPNPPKTAETKPPEEDVPASIPSQVDDVDGPLPE